MVSWLKKKNIRLWFVGIIKNSSPLLKLCFFFSLCCFINVLPGNIGKILFLLARKTSPLNPSNFFHNSRMYVHWTEVPDLYLQPALSLWSRSLSYSYVHTLPKPTVSFIMTGRPVISLAWKSFYSHVSSKSSKCIQQNPNSFNSLFCSYFVLKYLCVPILLFSDQPKVLQFRTSHCRDRLLLRFLALPFITFTNMSFFVLGKKI